MVLLKPGRHELFVRNVRYCDILYEGYMFCSVFYVSKLLNHKNMERKGMEDEQADYMRRSCKKN